MTDQTDLSTFLDGAPPIANRPFVLILQHPQEQRETLNTGRLAALQLENSILKVGLSWPSLRHVLGHDADPKRWAVLFLGTAKDFPGRTAAPLVLLDRAGKPVAGQDKLLAGLEGLVALDGTWSQAKTLWWRNPWLLKGWRLVLNPDRRSLYGSVRREPRREGLSTLEAVAFCLSRLNGDPALYDRLTAPFGRMLRSFVAPAETAMPPAENRGE